MTSLPSTALPQLLSAKFSYIGMESARKALALSKTIFKETYKRTFTDPLLLPFQSPSPFSFVPTRYLNPRSSWLTLHRSANMDAPNFTIDSQSLRRMNNLYDVLINRSTCKYFFPHGKNIRSVIYFVNNPEIGFFAAAGDPV